MGVGYCRAAVAAPHRAPPRLPCEWALWHRRLHRPRHLGEPQLEDLATNKWQKYIKLIRKHWFRMILDGFWMVLVLSNDHVLECVRKRK